MASEDGYDAQESDGGGVDADFAPASQPGDKDWIIRDQDRFLPIANVARIMKRMVPPPGKISKEAKECVQECLSEFILFISSEAAERAGNEKRKTIAGEDLLYALQELGFDNYVEPLQIYMQKYRAAMRACLCGKEPAGGGGAAAVPVRSTSLAVAHADDDDTLARATELAGTTAGPSTSAGGKPKRLINPVVNTAPAGHGAQLLTLTDGTTLQVDGATAQFLLSNQNACAAIAESGNRQQVMSQKQMMTAALQSNTIYVDPNSGRNYVPVQSDTGVIQLIPVEVRDRPPAKRKR